MRHLSADNPKGNPQSAKHVKNRVLRWSLFLQEYDFTVNYIKGSDNIGTGYRSRALKTDTHSVCPMLETFSCIQHVYIVCVFFFHFFLPTDVRPSHPHHLPAFAPDVFLNSCKQLSEKGGDCGGVLLNPCCASRPPETLCPGQSPWTEKGRERGKVRDTSVADDDKEMEKGARSKEKKKKKEERVRAGDAGSS